MSVFQRILQEQIRQVRVPTAKQLKLEIEPFDGKELCKGLGASFLTWGKRCVRALGFAEIASGSQWSEELRMECLARHPDGQARKYFQSQVG
ncbi:TPA: hypothetical protein N0F65_000877 [Lagenidium giganteum]|uniref:Uncharacterized protein n=1 Tax=Lagenidium giganteum TaxID=4803 RepID=A0AAV2Z1V7_9STRA|nr:TPA: hypothetical protein N0F65_000877 [Lagenidium giganteum]